MAVEKIGEHYRCNICGNEVTVTYVGGGELVCCGQPMEKVSGLTFKPVEKRVYDMNFSASEVIEIGVQIEINGRDFYNGLANKIKGIEIKEAFKYLAAQERAHIEVFRNILGSVQNYQPKESYPQEYFAYMNAMAADHVFTKKDKGREIAEGITRDRDAVNFAIGFEKDSILFYDGMKRLMPQKEHGIIEEVITEERKHVLKLLEIRSLM